MDLQIQRFEGSSEKDEADSSNRFPLRSQIADKRRRFVVGREAMANLLLTNTNKLFEAFGLFINFVVIQREKLSIEQF